MRLAAVFCMILVVLGISSAQQSDSNFPSGPQYLITGSPDFARSLQTPSLSLDAPLPGIPALPEVGPVVTDQPYVSNPELQQPNLFPIYYGYPQVDVVELTSQEPSRELPASMVDPGVSGMANAQSLRNLGFGVPLGDDAAYWKSHKPLAPHVYTNADVDRLRGQ